MTAESERSARFLAWRKKKAQEEVAQKPNGDVVDVYEFITSRDRERGRFGDSE